MRGYWAWFRVEMHVLSRLFHLEGHTIQTFADYIYLFGGWVQIPIRWRYVSCHTCRKSYYVRGKKEERFFEAVSDFWGKVRRGEWLER